MAWSEFTVFLIAVAVITITPGPDTLYVLGRSLGQGRSAGVLSAVGIFVGNLGHTLAAAIGLSAILMTSATAYMAIKYLGAVYLIYIGVRTIISRTHSPMLASLPRSSRVKVFYQAIFTNLLNPKAALFFLAFVPQFVSPDQGNVPLQFLGLGTIIAASSSLWLMLVAVLVSSIGDRLRHHASFSSFLSWLTGSLFILLGLRLAVPERS
ncbi:LysE family translocator [Oculatella sp. LEGE 06141]|uniref:LysE family translocator n=1 Tax=Oculatella sp. LEGE 06141 TaxID=1828648 RepID=UPI00187E478F|nr:LysE family translocator [Oculatella sp. LEGE 06141]MBE9178015.1 LysE family translocator [Oculatella sp. LEGE 06141]